MKYFISFSVQYYTLDNSYLLYITSISQNLLYAQRSAKSKTPFPLARGRGFRVSTAHVQYCGVKTIVLADELEQYLCKCV